jgi:catechol 2,3-dioxygenase-like lactoylglutathione lyase family enzyme
MKINELVLQTNKLAELKEFYGLILGMETMQQDDRFTVVTPATRLVFIKAVDDTAPFYHFAFNIPSNKIDEAFEWLRNKTALLWIEDYKSYIADFTNWHAKSVYFFDPAGNIVELIAREDLDDNVIETFSAGHIRSVSEVGMVFPADRFDEEVREFMARYGLTYFDKQPPLPQFRAIGNDEGLFIAVATNRAWYPTKHVLSASFPLRVLFTNDDLKRMLEII